MGNISTKFSETIGRIFSLHWMQNKSAKLLILGIDGAGKSTILYRWKLNEEVATIPTIGFNVESLQYKNITMTVFDIGGQTIVRRLWRYYYDSTDAIIYVVDSNDAERLQEAAEELHRVLADDRLSSLPVLIFANKQDLPNALSCPKIVELMKLPKLRNNWYMQPCIGISGRGLYEGMEWMGEQLKN